MLTDASPNLSATFHALAHPTRRAMLRMLADGKARAVGELAEPFEVSLAASSKHVTVLEKAGLVQRKVQGRVHSCRLAPGPLEQASDWTAAFRSTWERNFAALDEALEELEGARERATHPRKKPHHGDDQ